MTLVLLALLTALLGVLAVGVHQADRLRRNNLLLRAEVERLGQSCTDR